MRILHVTTFLQGGAGRIIASLAVAQRQAGHDVTVAVDAGGATGYASYPEYLRQLTEAGTAVHSVSSTFTRDLHLNVQAAARLAELMGPRPVDVVHTHAAIPTLVARLAFSRRPVGRLVQTMHGWGIHKTPEQAATDVALLGFADAVVTPSMAARETLRALGFSGTSLQVIPYGLMPDPGERRAAPSDAALLAGLRASGACVALCIGTIGARKDQALLVTALAACPDVTAVFIGDGDTAPLVARAQALGVGARVHVLGYREDASRYLADADMLVLPSRNEGLPLAVLEALRAGVPVVGSAIPEIAEAIDDGDTGFLFEPADAAALAVAMRRAVEAPDREGRRQRARAIFAARYELERMTTAYERLYRSQD